MEQVRVTEGTLNTLNFDEKKKRSKTFKILIMPVGAKDLPVPYLFGYKTGFSPF